MKYYIFCLLFIFWSGYLTAQVPSPQEIEPEKGKKIADEAYEEGDYKTAVSYYEPVFNVAPEPYMAFRIAESYKNLRNHPEAEYWYRKTYETDPVAFPLAQYQYALQLKMNEKYDQARQAFKEFIEDYQGEQVDYYLRLSEQQLAGIDSAQKWQENEMIIVENAGTTINSAYSEIAPVAKGDTLFFSALPSDTVIKVKRKEKNLPVVKIYSAEGEKDDWTEPQEAEAFNNDNFHTSNGIFSADGQRFYFSRCEQNYDTLYKDCSIYISRLEDGEWQKPEELPAVINLPDFTATQPAIGNAGEQEVLYFVSNRPGGEGGLDIWASELTAGEYSEPVNLGKKVNTSLDDVTPFYDPVEGALYFSSEGHAGMGGMDVFKAVGNLREWGQSKNLEKPVNSSVDDLYFILKNKNEGFLASNRGEGASAECKTCCFDIYSIEFKEEPILAISGFVVEEGDTAEAPINDAVVRLFMIGEGEDILIETDTTKNDEPFIFRVQFNQDYKLIGQREGYFSGQEYVRTRDRTTRSDTVEVNVNLAIKKVEIGKTYTISNIYYDYDKATLREESKLVLDTLSAILEEYPNLVIEIGSHTDSIASHAYNQRLSQRRAQSVVNYLVDKGLNKSRLIAKGYGETQPIAPNTNPDGTDNPEGRQLNRRTEFKIIGKLDENVDIHYKPPIAKDAVKDEGAGQ